MMITYESSSKNLAKILYKHHLEVGLPTDRAIYGKSAMMMIGRRPKSLEGLGRR